MSWEEFRAMPSMLLIKGEFCRNSFSRAGNVPEAFDGPRPRVTQVYHGRNQLRYSLTACWQPQSLPITSRSTCSIALIRIFRSNSSPALVTAPWPNTQHAKMVPHATSSERTQSERKFQHVFNSVQNRLYNLDVHPSWYVVKNNDSKTHSINSDLWVMKVHFSGTHVLISSSQAPNWKFPRNLTQS